MIKSAYISEPNRPLFRVLQHAAAVYIGVRVVAGHNERQLPEVIYRRVRAEVRVQVSICMRHYYIVMAI